MSGNIIVNMNQTPFTEIQGKSAINSNQNLHLKVAGFEKEKNEQSIKLDISNESRLKLANRQRIPNTISAPGQRSLWKSRGVRHDPNLGDVIDNELDVMRIDEPETYEKFAELLDKASELLEENQIDPACVNKSSKIGKAHGDLIADAMMVEYEWYLRRCVHNGEVVNPADKKYAVLDSLEELHSSDGQETSFNFYNPKQEDWRNGLWRFQSKFNVLISSDMLDSLLGLENLDELSDKDKNEKSGLLEKISESVYNMKETEKQYEGDLKELRFGVKLWDNGDVTYHANYKDCKNEYGIMADSAEELLEMLMKKE